ncbi:hypothetical protein CEXT_358671 [Caerostris extrusa]|uniref:Uncharacterized protein n=1 Tax=Caerostris extrusa TaxID=172846 RepID=A0AAV4MWP1_CAEEX|nr:hypothetical protein CEXT_358671 [Caerostris extrusa]
MAAPPTVNCKAAYAAEKRNKGEAENNTGIKQLRKLKVGQNMVFDLLSLVCFCISKSSPTGLDGSNSYITESEL